MKVFIPMPDEWQDPEPLLRERLVPYRCGIALLATLALKPAEAAADRALSPAEAPAGSAHRPA
jgi:hypothetical protein